MGFLSNLFGATNNFQAQSAAPALQNAFNANEVQNAQQQAQSGISQQQALANALQNQGGLQNQASVFNQLQNVASGQGPNPAQAMLGQATGANVANQAALAAGQRGGGANVGLMQRNAALQGANAEQQAAGQAATMQANQSLGALGQLGGLANQQVQNQIGGVQGLNAAIQGNQGQLISGLGQQNQQQLSNVQQQNAINAGVAQQNAQTNAGILGGVGNAIGGVLGSYLGKPTGKAFGGEIENPKLAATSPEHRFPEHVSLPPHLHEVASIYHGNKFGDVSQMPKFGYGGMLEGGQVPGKAKQSGDHLSNDTVKAKLSPKEVVLPRSVTMSDDPVGNAAKFMASILHKNGSKENPESDFKEALKRHIEKRKKK